MTRGSCSLDRSHVTSSETSWTRFILSSLSESLSDIPPSRLPRPRPSPSCSWTPFEPVPRRVPPLHLRSPYPPSLNLFSSTSRALVPLLSPALLSSSFVPCRRYVEYANKSCTNVPEVWTRSPINYSVGAADPPSLFFA